MARKKVREHDAKRLLRAQLKRAGLDLALRNVQVSPDTDWARLVHDNPWLAEGHLVAKRGKHKLVLLDAAIDAVKEFVTPRFTQELEVSGARGALTHWIVEPFVPHKEEYYLAITSEREADVIHFSTHGGMEVEENWDKGLVKELAVPLGQTLESLHFDKVLGIDTAPEAHQAKLKAFITAIFKVFTEQDFTLLELNPFTVTAVGEVVPLDMRAELDDCASYKHAKDWEGIHFPAPFGRKFHPEETYVQSLDGKTGASLKLTIINPNGRVWLLVAGGGASVIFADTVADIGCGSELGNYGEYSGAPNEEETYHYAKTLLDLATRNPDGRNRVLLIGGGIANFTDVAKTFKGIIHALEEYKEKLKAAKMRIFVRRAGPNYQLGLKMMRELGERLGVPIEVYGPEIPMTTIIPKAVAYLKQ